MLKKLAIIIVLAALLLPLGVSAQGNTLLVWNSLSTDDSGVLSDAAARFGDSSGAAVELQTVEPPYLLDLAMSAAQSGASGPDVIIAGNRVADPLIESGLLGRVDSGGFFLEDLLNALPSLIEQRCGDDAIESCLWPGTSSLLPIMVPDRASVQHTLDWLCVSSDWLPSCSGQSLPGVPVSWNFTILLFNTEWLAQNGLDVPSSLDSVVEIRSKYGLSVAQAQENFLPTASEVSPDAIYQVDSTMLSKDPAATMTSLASFYEAGYAAVVVVGIDSAYLSASAQHPDLASQFASFLGRDRDAQAGLLDSSQRLPAFSVASLGDWGIDTDEAAVTLQALTLLVTYASLAY